MTKKAPQQEELTASLSKNIASLAERREDFAATLEAGQPSDSAIIAKAEMDDDLQIAFNATSGHVEGQLVILQLQANRRLNQIVALLTKTKDLMLEEL